MKPLLIGEDNPRSLDPRYALYPLPKGCAGWRLCFKILGLTEREYLRTFDRVNLCEGPWDLVRARARSALILAGEPRTLILLGSKVAQAFGADFSVFTGAVWGSALSGSRGCFTAYRLPHPSGRCLEWNDPGAIDRARGLLRHVLEGDRVPRPADRVQVDDEG